MKEVINTLIKNRKPLLAGLALLAVVALWLGSSIVSLVHNKIETNRLVRKSAALDNEHKNLLHTKELLEAQDPALVEKIARTEYDLAKPNEIEFRFTDNK